MHKNFLFCHNKIKQSYDKGGENFESNRCFKKNRLLSKNNNNKKRMNNESNK